jgi:hypothetical protein
LAVWAPIGLVQPTTLPFGQKNSGTEAQGPYRAAASKMQRERHGNYVDDWIGYSNDLDQLIDDFDCFLQVCEKYAITLGIGKTRFGYSEAECFGFRVNKEGSHLAFKHWNCERYELKIDYKNGILVVHGHYTWSIYLYV